MLLIWLAVIIICVGALWYKKTSIAHGKKSVHKNQKNVAHANRVRATKSYQKIIRQYRRLVLAATGLAVIATCAAAVLTLRPASVTIEQPDIRNRDIMLCLDISGSMRATDIQLLTTFTDVAKNLKGERIGLTVFDSSSKSVFPLTDDYQFIADKLKQTIKSFNYGGPLDEERIYQGTNEGEGSSLIGDGLASCLLRFDNQKQKRSRSVILATDNYTNGEQIVTFPQAIAFAKQKSIRVYGINPSDYSNGDYTSKFVNKNSKEFHDQVLATGGTYYRIDYENRNDSSFVTTIVKNISSQEATRFKGTPQVVQNDTPVPYIIILLVGVVGLMTTLWRLRV